MQKWIILFAIEQQTITSFYFLGKFVPVSSPLTALILHSSLSSYILSHNSLPSHVLLDSNNPLLPGMPLFFLLFSASTQCLPKSNTKNAKIYLENIIAILSEEIVNGCSWKQNKCLFGALTIIIPVAIFWSIN